MKGFVVICLICFITFFAMGCYSVPEEIPADLTAEELIQLAQFSYDSGNTKAAQAYYETIIIRYSHDINLLIEAEYEIAHMKIKERKWAQAVPDLQRILHYYETDTTGTLPLAYKKLAQIDLAKVPAHELEKINTTQFVTEE